jgi:hypothetical protein
MSPLAVVMWAKGPAVGVLGRVLVAVEEEVGV